MVRKKKRPVNPRIELLVRKELFKLIEDNIIFPIKHYFSVHSMDCTYQGG